MYYYDIRGGRGEGTGRDNSCVMARLRGGFRRRDNRLLREGEGVLTCGI